MEALLLIALGIITFVSRIINLTNIPIFTDEAIYIRWAQIGLHDPAHRYISLTDGKQPLLTWMMYPFLMIFKDPLFAGRFVSVIASVFTVIGIYFVAKELFGKKAGLFSTIVYLISPFPMLYDRLALMDSLLAGAAVWSLYLSVLLVRYLKLDVALLLGITAGLGMLTKSSAEFFIFSLPLLLLLFDFKTKDRKKRFLKLTGLSLISISIAFVMYNSLRLSPWFYVINQKNHVFIYTFSEIMKNPIQYFLPNLNGLTQILLGYLTIPIDIIIILMVMWAFMRKDKRVIYLFLWFAFPFISLAVFGKVIFPRFILFMIIPFYIISGFFLANLLAFANNKMKYLNFLIPIFLIYPAFQSMLIITNPVDVNIPKTDRNQLFDDWPSGDGVKSVITYLNKEADKGKIVIGTEGTFGLNPAVYEIYMKQNKNVEIYGFWPVFEVPKILLEKSREIPTYLIFKEKQNIPNDWPLTLIAKYRRGKGDTYLLFYQVDPAKWKNS